MAEPRPAATPALPARDRFAAMGPRAALAVMAALIGLILLGVLVGPLPTPPRGGPPANDRALYLRVIDDVHRGQSYYPAAVRAHRRENYPLRPFLAVRPPTLAVAMAALPDPNARRLSVEALAVVMILAWAWRLRTMADRPVGFAVAIFLVAAATVPAFIDYGYALHEVWSGELIALSLAVHGPRRWPASVAIALLALGVRELAAPYLLAMGVLAWREGRRREALAWALAILAGLVGLALHAEAVGSLTRPDDLTSAGWLVLGGWRFLLLLLKWNGVLLTAPAWVVATLAPLALLGLVAARGPLGDRLALVVVGYGAAFLVVGRPDNAYWGLMIAPLWPIGLLSTLPALRGLAGKVLTLRGRAPCSP